MSKRRAFLAPPNYGPLPWVYLLVVVMYLVALPLMLIAELASPWLKASPAIAYNRWGLLLQILAAVSALPEVLGSERLSRLDQALQTASEEIRNLRHRLAEIDAVTILSGKAFPELGVSRAGRGVLLLNSILWGATSLLLAVSGLVLPGGIWFQLGWAFLWAHTTVGLLLLSPIVLVFRTLRVKQPELLSLLIDVFTTEHLYYFALPLSIAVAPILDRLVSLCVAFTLRRMVAVVSFPIFIAGLVLQLLATFY